VWFRKIFNVSLHRSGTQSIHDLLVRSGVSSIHWPGVVKGVNYEALVAGHENDPSYVTAALAPVIDMVTAVGDVPIAALYEQLEHTYANSAFILAYRSPFDWVRSVRSHIRDRDLNVFEKVQYWRYLADRPASLRTIEDTELYSVYLTHLRDVLAFFEKRRNFLFLDLQEPEAGERICGFLEFPPIALRRIDFRLGNEVPTRVFDGV
jgi:hypothetical protein